MKTGCPTGVQPGNEEKGARKRDETQEVDIELPAEKARISEAGRNGEELRQQMRTRVRWTFGPMSIHRFAKEPPCPTTTTVTPQPPGEEENGSGEMSTRPGKWRWNTTTSQSGERGLNTTHTKHTKHETHTTQNHWLVNNGNLTFLVRNKSHCQYQLAVQHKNHYILQENSSVEATHTHRNPQSSQTPGEVRHQEKSGARRSQTPEKSGIRKSQIPGEVRYQEKSDARRSQTPGKVRHANKLTITKFSIS